MSTKRYTVYLRKDGVYDHREDATGQWVSWQDHSALERDRDALKEAIKAANKACEEREGVTLTYWLDDFGPEYAVHATLLRSICSPDSAGDKP